MRRTCLGLSAIALAMPAQASVTAREVRQVAVIVAHPDDELFIAPAIAHAARDGAEVTLVFATSGDQGPGVSQFEKGAALAEKREEEARCAARALGVGTVLFLRLGDGTLGDKTYLPDSPAKRLTARIAAILHGQRFDTILTWGPDGGYGHGDHRMVSAIVTEVVQSLGEGRPDLLYSGIRSGTLPPVPQMQDWAVTAPALLPVAFPYDGGDLARARAAARCHATQFPAEEREGMADLFDTSIWQGAVHFRRAFGHRAAEANSANE